MSNEQNLYDKINDIQKDIKTMHLDLLKEIRNNREDIAILKLKVTIIAAVSGIGGAGAIEFLKKIFI